MRCWYISILIFVTGLRAYQLFPSQGKSRYSVYLHTFMTLKICYNIHSLYMFSKDQSKFELLFRTQDVELLRRYIVITILHDEAILIQQSQKLSCSKDFYCQQNFLKASFCSRLRHQLTQIKRTGLGKLLVVI